MTKRLNYLFIIFLLTASLLHSCAPTKNTAIRRVFHNLVTRYNIYFNGSEAMRQGKEQLANSHKDNYYLILDIFKYGTEAQVQSITPLMDRAIDKGSKAIVRHSMFFNSVEYNNWVKKSYILIGKARFFKREYLSAIEMFDFVTKRFVNDPVRYDAMLWLAKSYIYSERYSNCLHLFGGIERQLKEDKDILSEEVIRMYPKVRADYYIKTNDLEKAAEYLHKSLAVNERRKEQIRLNFILGQVYQKLNKNDKAFEHYQLALRRNPSYGMAFRAKLFSAQTYESGMGKSGNIIAQLHKMLRNENNKDYKDEIYYALAQLEMNNNNLPKAIEYLKLSTETSTNNKFQKSLSFLRLGEIFYNKKEYNSSKLCYDSAMISIPENFPNYGEINSRSELLTRLIDNLNTIELQDSLLSLSKMTEAQQVAVVDKIIQEIIREEEEQRRRERERQQALLAQHSQDNVPVTSEGSWYFYNLSTVRYGKAEFLRLWGERVNEDLWRLSNKTVVAFDDFADAEWDEYPDSLEQEAPLTDRDRKFYLKNIPNTPEKIEIAENKIKNALYNAGSIFYNSLKEYEGAIKLFEELVRRFPDSDLELKTYYNLYKLYETISKHTEKQKYKDHILTKYPNSEIARMISDPDYFQKIEQQKDVAKEYYKVTYLTYKNNEFTNTIIKSDSALNVFNDTELLSKFAYLKALSIAKINDNEAMVSELEFIIENYPNTEIRPYAEFLLSHLKIDSLSGLIGYSDTIAMKPKSKYLINDTSFHLFVLIVDIITANTNKIRASISDHNSEFFRGKNLTVSNLFLTDTRHMITVNRFENKKEAEKYYQFFKNSEKIMSIIKDTNPFYFVISTDNYPGFYRDKDETGYSGFFINNYKIN